MRALGRRGGLLGGVARARALSPRRRTQIAQGAAEMRWQPECLVLSHPQDDEELQCFVSQYGNGHAQSVDVDSTSVLLRALVACRDNACLARMLPVFIWRARGEIFEDPKKLQAASAEKACALGFFLELTHRFGKLPEARGTIRALRRQISSVASPIVLFHSMNVPLLRDHAVRLTSPLARSWKLILGEPDVSFESYFKRAVKHAAF